MSAWSTDAVLSTAAAWTWVPYDAVTRESQRCTVVSHGGRAYVHRAEGGTAEELIADAHALADGLPVQWIVHDLTEPADLTERLLAHSAELDEDLDVIALDLAGGLPDVDVPGDVTVNRVDTAEELARVYPITRAVFGKPASAEFVAADTEELLKQVAAGDRREVFRFLAYVDGEPAGHGGMTLDDGVAKLWGGCVLDGHRGRGLYRALLHARLEEAAGRGGELALVKARTGTSSPILRRAGFTVYGRERHYLISA